MHHRRRQGTNTGAFLLQMAELNLGEMPRRPALGLGADFVDRVPSPRADESSDVTPAGGANRLQGARRVIGRKRDHFPAVAFLLKVQARSDAQLRIAMKFPEQA